MVRRLVLVGAVAAYAIACTALLSVATVRAGENQTGWMVLSFITLGAAPYLAAIGALFVAYASGLLLALNVPEPLVAATEFAGFTLVFAAFGILLWMLFRAVRSAVVSIASRVQARR